jgi:hypothetical protein
MFFYIPMFLWIHKNIQEQKYFIAILFLLQVKPLKQASFDTFLYLYFFDTIYLF